MTVNIQPKSHIMYNVSNEWENGHMFVNHITGNNSGNAF